MFQFLTDSTNIVSAESVPQQQIHDSCEESDEEWNYMKTKEGQTEKENKNNASFTEDFKENIEPEPATEKEISSVELKEQLDLTPDLESPAAVDTATSIENTSAPAFDIEPLSPEPVSFESDVSIFFSYWVSDGTPIGGNIVFKQRIL